MDWKGKAFILQKLLLSVDNEELLTAFGTILCNVSHIRISIGVRAWIFNMRSVFVVSCAF